MARYTGSVCRQCRREGVKLFLKGDRCYGAKCALSRRSNPPGMHKQSRRKVSEYGLQLREKQKARRSYGVLEKQFERYFDLAERKKGVTGENLFQLLERRLDNVVYRLGFCASRAQARQYVTHGHFTVNGKKVNIPSYLVDAGDVITVKATSRDIDRFKLVRDGADRAIPSWLDFNADGLEGRIVRLPGNDDLDANIQQQLIVELYSR